MFDHLTIRVADRDASTRFYDTVLGTLGLDAKPAGEHYVRWGDFLIARADDAHPVTRGVHIGFSAASRAHVDEFWRAGTEAGYRDDGEPGPRPEYRYDYYGGFLLDPDGNSAEAVHHGALRRGGAIDHVWLRVADVTASKVFYERVAAHAGFRVLDATADRAHFGAGNGSFSVVAGEPTENLHLAFPAGSNDAVDAWHADLAAAGYADNGAPGERPAYHPGYYGAFVLDPDGNNVELVNHNR